MQRSYKGQLYIYWVFFKWNYISFNTSIDADILYKKKNYSYMFKNI